MTPHLSHEQLCDLLLSNRAFDARILASDQLETARDHVRECNLCAGELAALGDSLSLFRNTANSWASHEWNHQSLLQNSRLKPATARGLSSLFPRPAIVWAAAAAIAVAVPYSLHQFDSQGARQNAAIRTAAPRESSSRPQSDEALFEEISQTVSYSVPVPMQPLADSTAGPTSRTQRKN